MNTALAERCHLVPTASFGSSSQHPENVTAAINLSLFGCQKSNMKMSQMANSKMSVFEQQEMKLQREGGSSIAGDMPMFQHYFGVRSRHSMGTLAYGAGSLLTFPPMILDSSGSLSRSAVLVWSNCPCTRLLHTWLGLRINRGTSYLLALGSPEQCARFRLLKSSSILSWRWMLSFTLWIFMITEWGSPLATVLCVT